MEGGVPGVIWDRFGEAGPHRVGGLAVVVNLGGGQPVVEGRARGEGLDHGVGRPVGSMKFRGGNAMPRTEQPGLLRNGTSDQPHQQF